MQSKADREQIAGKHYKEVPNEYQHWNVAAALGWDYFTGQVTKYLWRWRQKNGVEDLRKAAHYLQKYIELAEAGKLPQTTPPKPEFDTGEPQGRGYVDQDR